MGNFIVLPAELGEENPVRQPRAARNTRGHHRWDGTIVNNRAVGYVPVAYEHQAFPRMMYHPKWGMTPEPEMAKYAIGCVTAEQFQNAFAAYTKAVEDWKRKNRVKLAETQEDFDRLVKKGWLDKAPLRKENPAFDMNSEEI
jgi:ribosomal protein L15